MVDLSMLAAENPLSGPTKDLHVRSGTCAPMIMHLYSAEGLQFSANG